MADKRQPRYSGALNQPIVLDNAPLGPGLRIWFDSAKRCRITHEGGRRRLRQHQINNDTIIRKRRAKFHLLMRHYKIEPEGPARFGPEGFGPEERARWRQLALHLALDHVPGMRISERHPPALEAWVTSKRIAKLDVLLAYYEIEPKNPDCWEQLSYILAVTYVPGMQVSDPPSPGKGAPRKWDFHDYRKLVELIEQIKHEREKGTKDAIRIALKRKHLKGTEQGLERRYYEARRRLEEAGKSVAYRFISTPDNSKLPASQDRRSARPHTQNNAAKNRG